MSSPRVLLERLAAAWPRVDPTLYAVFAAAIAIASARSFYGSMFAQTGGAWSAPLDDVFIHFDYARATARGYFFNWTEGNGFSSGNTSLVYPLVLAAGYRLGFEGMRLMPFASFVAGASVFAYLLLAARFFEPFGRWAKYLLPPVALSVGALDWSLWSGMENALHLAVWGALASSALGMLELARARAQGAFEASTSRRLARAAWRTGAFGFVLFITRPESVVCVAAFGLLGAAAAWRARRGCSVSLGVAMRVGVPAALGMVGQALANRLLTGEVAANGAIAKLAINHPYMTAAEKWNEWTFHFTYAVLRNTQHHFADALPYGWLVPLVALVAVYPRRTRAVALTLWAQVVGWLALVALNGQVRWQNERYTMPAVAWLLLLAGLGLAVLASGAVEWARGERPSLASRLARSVAFGAGVIAAAVFAVHQAPRFKDQTWFFGRASRNILDQHLTAGVALRRGIPVGRGEILRARRLLVGDAGALLYASDKPGIDLIGLGGYHDLPFARAGVHGQGASLELIERLPDEDQPDVMALYPGWWGDLPVIFGERVAEFPVVGNVICGGASKVIYRADWSALDRAGLPRTARIGDRIIDAVDIADLVDERRHAYAFPRPGMGFVTYRVLPDPVDRMRDLFDAGRVIPEGESESAMVRLPSAGGWLVVRTAEPGGGSIDVEIDGHVQGKLEIPPARGWVETTFPLEPGLPAQARLTLRRRRGALVVHHIWILAGSRPALAR